MNYDYLQTLAVLILIVFFLILCLYLYIWNFLIAIKAAKEMRINIQTIARWFGIFIPILGVIMGLISNNDPNSKKKLQET